MQKPISTATHGVIDYVWSAAATALPKAMNSAGASAQLVRSAGAAAAMTSMMTNYERGAWRLLPMRVHLALDFVMCSALVASPLFLPQSERRYWAIPVALGAVGLLAGLMTQTQSPFEIDEEFGGFSGRRQLSTIADQDPDIAAAPNLRLHLE